MNSRKAARLQLGDAAVISPSEAAGLLPISDARARRWLREKDLIRDLDGTDVVIWGEVLDALRVPDEPKVEPSPRPPKPIMVGGRRKVSEKGSPTVKELLEVREWLNISDQDQ